MAFFLAKMAYASAKKRYYHQSQLTGGLFSTFKFIGTPGGARTPQTPFLSKILSLCIINWKECRASKTKKTQELKKVLAVFSQT